MLRFLRENQSSESQSYGAASISQTSRAAENLIQGMQGGGSKVGEFQLNQTGDILINQLQLIGDRLTSLLGKLEQPQIQFINQISGSQMQVTHATRRWWRLTKLLHVITDMEHFTRCRLQMKQVYKRLRVQNSPPFWLNSNQILLQIAEMKSHLYQGSLKSPIPLQVLFQAKSEK